MIKRVSETQLMYGCGTVHNAAEVNESEWVE